MLPLLSPHGQPSVPEAQHGNTLGSTDLPPGSEVEGNPLTAACFYS